MLEELEEKPVQKKKEVILVPRGCISLEAYNKCMCNDKCRDLVPQDHPDVIKLEYIKESKRKAFEERYKKSEEGNKENA